MYNFGLWLKIETLRIRFKICARFDPRCGVARNKMALIDETMLEYFSSV